MRLITKSDTSARRIAAVGMYDGVHAGHRFLLDYLRIEAKGRGLTPSVVTFSRHPLSLVRPLEAPSLLMSLEDRVGLLGESGADDVVLLSFNESLRRMSAREFLSMLHRRFGIDALVLGFNNRFGHDGVEGLDHYRAIGQSIGVDVIQAPEYRGEGSPVSSSAIRRHLMAGRPAEAVRMLGTPYTLRGKVVDGQHLGRTIGYPTANIQPVEPAALIPKTGVYAARVVTPDGVRRGAMVNIGYRPTVTDTSDSSRTISIEAHIFDFEGYIYDEEIILEFVDYLRPERRFESTGKLKSQLADDEKKIRRLLS